MLRITSFHRNVRTCLKRRYNETLRRRSCPKGLSPLMRHRLIEKQVLYEGKRIRLEIHHLDDEETGKRLRREVVVHPGAVVILGFLDDGRLLLIRNRRYTINQDLIE